MSTDLLLWRERDGQLSRWPDDASIFNHFEEVTPTAFVRLDPGLWELEPEQ